MDKTDFALKIENVSKSFKVPTEKKDSIKSYFINPFRRIEKKKFDALTDVSFEVKKGEFFGIIGRNGSGKSTLLKLIAGIYQPGKGKITLNGAIIPFLELGVGFNPELSGRENIFLNGTILGMKRDYLQEKFDEIVDFAEVRDFIDMPLKNYSSGMQVRLAFAITTVTDGDIYLMDEVLAVGDINFQSKCLEVLNNYRAKQKAIILVSHDTTAIEKFCSRAVLLQNGKVKKIGETREVVDCYTMELMEDAEVERTDHNKKAVAQGKVATNKVIAKVRFLDKKGNEVNTFKTGEYFSAEVTLKLEKKIPNVDVGISFESDEGVYLFGYNTEMDRYRLSTNSSTCRLVIPKLELLSGRYHINVAVFDGKNNHRYGFVPRMASFLVYSFGASKQYKGYFNIEHKWEALIR